MSDDNPQVALPTPVPGMIQVDLVERMQSKVDAWQINADERAIFLNCYLLMTRNMLVAVEQGEFYDMTWVRSLVHRFAQHYFNSLDAYDQDPDSTLKVWRVAHQSAASGNMLVMQNLMLGINAHINYDLVFAVVEMLEDEWPTLSPEQRQARYEDHSHVNKVIGRTIDSVQDQVINRLTPAYCLVDKALGPMDEWMTERLITIWRDTVWDQAVRILACHAADDREALRVEVEQIALSRAAAILIRENFATLDDLR